MTRIAFSVAVRDDRRAITAYTVERFGIHQARRLRATFERVLNTRADTATTGRPRHELDPPGRTFRYFVMMKLFVIVYEPTSTGIRVARILHGMRRLELDRDTGDDRRRWPIAAMTVFADPAETAALLRAPLPGVPRLRPAVFHPDPA